jgi:hypothetical protein
MTMHRFLPFRWRTRIDATRHAEAIVDVLDTAPIVPRTDGLVLFSMIGTAVVLPYLVAVKSLWAQLQRGRVALLDDGTLTAQDRAILAHHCGDPAIFRIDQVQRGAFPAGGCWERFLTILDHRRGEYWLQLDSDTVTLGPVEEVERAIASNRSFTLLGGPNAVAEPLPLPEFAAQFYPAGPQQGHVQQELESRFGLIDGGPNWRYLRGCAGFAGFAAGGPGRTLAASFLQAMTDLVGPERVTAWGTEQVASNFHVANDAAPVALPYHRYLNYWGEPSGQGAAFVHFVGTHRHANGAYAAASRRVIDQLLQR